MRFHSFIWSLMVVWGLLNSSPAQAETEPNDEQASANAIGFSGSGELVGLSVALESGSISGDEGNSDDWFSFDGTEGERVTITSWAPEESALNTRIHLVRPNGTAIANSVNHGPGDSARITDHALDVTGEWAIRVERWGGTEGEYALHVIRVSGGVCEEEQESSNEEQENGELMSKVSTGIAGSSEATPLVAILDEDETDWFGIHGYAGETLTLTGTAGPGSSVALSLKLVTANGLSVNTAGAAGGGTATIGPLELPTTGLYGLEVTGTGAGFKAVYFLEAQGVGAPTGSELEPNDDQASSTPLMVNEDADIDGVQLWTGQGEFDLTGDSSNDWFSFEANQGDRISVTQWTQSGEVSGRIYLHRPSGTGTVSDVESGPGTTARISDIELTESGLWALRVQNWNNKSGDYGVQIVRQTIGRCEEEQDGSNDDQANANPLLKQGTGAVSEAGSVPLMGILDSGDTDWYSIFGSVGESFTVTVRPWTSSSLVPSVRLLDSSGSELAQASAGEDGAAVLGPFDLQETSLHYLEITGTGAGFWGNYEVRVSATNTPAGHEIEPNDDQASATALDLQLDPFIPGLYVAYGAGEQKLVGDNSNDYFSFEGEEGDLVSFSSWATSGDINVRAYLVRPDGVQVASDVASGPDDTARFTGFALTESGTWGVRLENWNNQGGSYGLQVLRHGGALESEKDGDNDLIESYEPAPMTGTGQAGQAQSEWNVGVLDTGEQDIWALLGHAGDVLSIEVLTATGSSLDAAFSVTDATGQVLAEGISDQGGNTSVQDLALVETGLVYVALSANSGDGYEAVYGLHLTVENRSDQAELEVNDSLEQAQPLTLVSDSSIAGLSTATIIGDSGYLAGNGSDYYSLQLEEGQRVLLSLHPALGTTSINRVHLMRPGGVTVENDIWDGPGDTARIYDREIMESGVWKIHVEPWNNPSGLYRMQVHVLDLGGRTESDPDNENDDLAKSDDLGFSGLQRVLGILDEGDIDHLSFVALSQIPTSIEILTPDGSSLVAQGTVTDDQGVEVPLTGDPPTFTLPQAGTVQVKLEATSGAGLDGLWYLQLDTASGGVAGVSYEQEENDSTSEATAITLSDDAAGEGFYGARIDGWIGTGDNNDYFALDLDQGDRLFATLDLDAEGAKGELSILDGSGSKVGLSALALLGHDVVLRGVLLESAGPYTLRVKRSTGESQYVVRLHVGPEGTFAFGGQLWSVDDEPRNWHRARAHAASNGRVLATVVTDEEREFVAKAFGQGTHWTGFHDVDGDDVWTSLTVGGGTWYEPTATGDAYTSWKNAEPAYSGTNGYAAVVVGWTEGLWASKNANTTTYTSIQHARPVQIVTPRWSEPLVVGDAPWTSARLLDASGAWLSPDGDWELSDGRSVEGMEAGYVTLLEEGILGVSVDALDGETSVGDDMRELQVMADQGFDLVIAGAEAPTELVVGESVSVTFQVANAGSAKVTTTSVHDALYLSNDSVFDITDARVDYVKHTKTVEAGEGYEVTLSFDLDEELASGLTHLIVVSDESWRVVDSYRENNHLALPVLVDYESLEDEVPFEGVVASNGAESFFALEVGQGESLSLTITAEEGECVEVYLGQGAPPVRGQSENTVTVCDGTETFSLSNPAPGTWYVLVYGAKAGTTYSLTADTYSLGLASFAPGLHANTGQVTLSVTGAGFEPGLSVKLVADNGTEYAVSDVEVVGASSAYGELDLEGMAPGLYTVTAELGAASAQGAESFQITEATGDEPEVEVSLVVPSEVGRHALAILYATVTNLGDVSVSAPIVLVTGSDLALMTLHADLVTVGFWTDSEPEGFSDHIFFLASGASAGTLAAGESITVPIYYAGLQQPWDMTDDGVDFQSYLLHEGNTEPIDWDALGTSIRPADVSDEDWEALLPWVAEDLGETWGDLHATMVSSAQQEAKMALDGSIESSTATAVAKYVSQAVGEATGLISIDDFETKIDMAVPAPGLRLRQARCYDPRMNPRQRVGMFGKGWQNEWEVALEELGDGSIKVHACDATMRHYKSDSRGGFFPAPGSTSTLVELGAGQYRITEENGLIREFENGRQVHAEDLFGNTIVASWQDSETLTELTHSSGATLSFAYTDGLLTEVSDQNGNTVTYAYDGADRLVSATRPDGTVHSYTWGVNEFKGDVLLTSWSIGDELQRAFSYDDRTRLTSDKGGAIEGINYGYMTTWQGYGSVLHSALPGETWWVGWDARYLLSYIIDPDGYTTRFGFDSNHRLNEVVDPMGYSIHLEHDAQGRPIQRTSRAGRVELLSWGSGISLSGYTDANGQETTVTRGASNEALQVDFPDGTHVAFTYDELGLVTSMTDRAGVTTSYTHDTTGAFASVVTGVSIEHELTYDTLGRPLGATGTSGTAEWTRDANGRLIAVDGPGSIALAFEYDEQGRVVSREETGGETTLLEYDGGTRVGMLLSGASADFEVQYTYDAAGREVTRTLGNGVSTETTYTPLGKRASVLTTDASGGVVASFVSTYDPVGRPTSVATHYGTWTYGYDVDGRITSAALVSTDPDVSSTSITYEWDAAGNRITTTVDGVAQSATFDPMNVVTACGAWSFTYDDRGGMTSRSNGGSSASYTYDDQGRMSGRTGVDGEASHTYDAWGRRLTGTLDGESVSYTVDPSGAGHVVSIRGADGSLLLTCPRGQRVEGCYAASDAPRYFVFDTQGNVAAVTSASGEVLNRYAYTPFGAPVLHEQSVSNPFTWGGGLGVMRESDDLYFMRTRYYSASLGRFLTADSRGLAGGDMNLYAYALGHPTGFADPTGTGPIDGLVGALFGGGVDLAGNAGDGIDAGDVVSAGNSTLLGMTGRLLPPGIGGAAGIALNPDNYNDIGNGLLALRDPFHHRRSQLDEALCEIDGNCGDGFDEGGDGGSGTSGSIDPNEKTGPAGVGEEGWILPGELIPYRIDFENDAIATAPAQQVDIIDPLSEDLDWSTFELTSVGWGDVIIPIEPGTQWFQHIEPFSHEGVDFEVHIYAGIDVTTGMMETHFYSIDPTFGVPPGVNIGFLPPEDETGRGMGFVTFNIHSKAGLESGTQLSNIATIIFDLGESIDTNQIDPHDKSQGTDPTKECRNRIDADAPTSLVTSPATSAAPEFMVSWSGDDPHSGVASYDVFARADGGAWSLWLDDTELTSSTYAGQMGTTYDFYSVAQDGVGHVELKEPIVEATTVLDPPHPCVAQGCDDADACTIETCDQVAGCSYEALVCADDSVCTTDSCDAAQGCVFTELDCEDGDACTADSCDAAQGCVSSEIICDDDFSCTTDSCDATEGCLHEASDAACDDDLACNGVETCDADSGCVEGVALVCDDGDACTTDGCDEETGCVTAPLDCADGDACTVDTCDPSSGCQSEALLCDDGDACTVDSCDVQTGCSTEPVDCDDDDACNGQETCDPVDGCSAGAALDCDDGDACTTDSCEADSGCVQTPVACDDGDPCTTDTCDASGGCASEAIVCDDEDPCTSDSCDASGACVHEDNGTCPEPVDASDAGADGEEPDTEVGPDVVPDSGPSADVTTDSAPPGGRGCSCQAAGQSPSADGWLVMLLVLLALGRRRATARA